MEARWIRIGIAIACAGLLAGAAMAQDSGDEVAAELDAVAAWMASPVYAQPSTPQLREPEATVFFSDFDSDNGGLVGSLDWEWSTSFAWLGTNCYNTSNHPPAGPYSGTGMWGTVINNCYSDLGNNTGYATCTNGNPADDSILSFSVDLSGYTDATLSWWEWYDLFSNFDWAEVYANGTPVFQHCETSYTAPTAWVQQTADLTPYVGGMVTIEFHMMASTVVNYAGWYIDDVLVDGTQVPVELQTIVIE